MKNVHLIPTNKPSRLWTNNLRRRLELDEFPEQHPNNIAKHIYITNSEEIKHLDYYITKIKDSNGERYSVGQRLDTNDSDYSNCKKIILTTDKDLIKDGVQAISDKFLEWFVKNPSCEMVEVDLWTIEKRKGEYFNPPLKEYEIIIPKEEPKVLSKLEIAKNIAAIGIGKEKPKQETLEEAAEKYVKSDLKKTPLYWLFHDTFKAGAKWQQKQDKKMYNEEDMRETVNWKAVYEESLSMQRTSNAGYESKINELKEKIKTMCSEEDMINFAEFVAKYPDKNKNVNGEMLHAKSKYDSSERTIDLLQEWIKKFKKK